MHCYLQYVSYVSYVELHPLITALFDCGVEGYLVYLWKHASIPIKLGHIQLSGQLGQNSNDPAYNVGVKLLLPWLRILTLCSYNVKIS